MPCAPELKARKVEAKVLQSFLTRHHHRLHAFRSVLDCSYLVLKMGLGFLEGLKVQLSVSFLVLACQVSQGPPGYNMPILLCRYWLLPRRKQSFRGSSELSRMV